MNSNNKLARAAGFLYLITIIAGGFAKAFVREGLTVYGDAVATAQNILASEQMYRFGFVADLVCIICSIFLSLIFYILFKPVNRNLSLLALIFGSVASAVMAVNLLNQLAPLLLLHNTNYLKAFTIEQLQTQSLFFLNLQSQGYNISLLLFAFYFPIIGWLVYKSNFLPRFLGVLYTLAGVGYLTNSLAWFLFPNLAAYLFPYVLLPAFIGEVSMSLWLIVKGIKIPNSNAKEIKKTKTMTRIKLSANNLFYIIFCMAVILTGCKAQNKITSTGLSDNTQLKELVRIDQQMRQSDTVVEMEPIDKKHRAVVMALLATGQIKTSTDKFNASLILQHTALTFCDGKLVSISPENYFLAYQLAKSAFESGDKRVAYMTAATYDRYLLYTEGYQKYGTQRVPDEVTGDEVWAPIDLKTTDEERAKYNVPPLTELLKKYKIKPFPNSK